VSFKSTHVARCGIIGVTALNVENNIPELFQDILKIFNFQDFSRTFFRNFQIPGLFQDVLKFQDTVGTLDEYGLNGYARNNMGQTNDLWPDDRI